MRKLILAILLFSAAVLVGRDFLGRQALHRVDKDITLEYQWKTINDPINFKADVVAYTVEYGGGVSIDSVVVVGYSPSNGYVLSEIVLWDSALVAGTNTAAVSDTLGRAANLGVGRNQIKYKVKADTSLGTTPYLQFFRTDLGK